MSHRKRTPAFLVTVHGKGRVDKNGDVEISPTHAELEPVVVEYEEPGEVVYEASDSRSTSVGYSAAFASGWERTFGSREEESLPN